MPRAPLALLLTVVFTLAPLPPRARPAAPAQPTAFTLDGVRDPAYVLVAEDPAGDYVPADLVRFSWADVTRLYAATDATHLYVYADLPLYTPAHSSGEFGLAILLPGSANVGPAPDRLPNEIVYDFDTTTRAACPGEPIAPTRPPDFLIRGFLYGPNDGINVNSGYTYLDQRSNGAWVGDTTDWGHLGANDPISHIAYGWAAGLELFIPWADLGVADPASLSQLQLAFFTTSAWEPGAYDSVPHDPHAPSATTSHVLSRVQTVPLPLHAPQSVAIGCEAFIVDEGAGTAAVPVHLNTALTHTVAVSYTATSLTAGPADFTPVTGTLTFTPGVTRQSISLQLHDDTLVEGPETLSLSLSSPLSLTLAAPVTATLTLLDDDVPSTNHPLFIPLIRR